MFTVAVTMISLASAFIDTLAEGVSSIITKKQAQREALNNKLKNLQEEEKPNDEIKSFANFATIRGIIKLFMTFFGGFFAEKIDIKVAYIIGIVYPAIFFFSVLIFKEEKVTRS